MCFYSGVIQNDVLLLQAGHESVPHKVVAAVPILPIGPHHLLVEAVYGSREQAIKTKELPLLAGKGRALVVKAVGQKSTAIEGAREMASRSEREGSRVRSGRPQWGG